jgi:hypothetical protein
MFTYGGHWDGLSDMGDIDSWISNPLLSTSNPRKVPFDMFQYLNHHSDGCLEVPEDSKIEDDSITSECYSIVNEDSGALSFEVREDIHKYVQSRHSTYHSLYF